MTIREKCEAAKNAAPTLAQADAATRNGAILKMARYLRGEANAILAANETDLKSAGRFVHRDGGWSGTVRTDRFRS